MTTLKGIPYTGVVEVIAGGTQSIDIPMYLSSITATVPSNLMVCLPFENPSAINVNITGTYSNYLLPYSTYIQSSFLNKDGAFDGIVYMRLSIWLNNGGVVEFWFPRVPIGCPANMTRPTPTGACVCKPGFVPDPSGAAGCITETYTLLLYGANCMEPWSAKRDPQHLKSNEIFTVIVRDNNGNPKPNIPVNINSDVTTDLAIYNDGHEHTDNRPKGKLRATPAGMANAPSTLTVTTDAGGQATFYFGAEQAAGEHTITAKCDKCTNGPRTVTMHAEFPGLVKIGDDNTVHPYFELRGGTATSSDNHHSDNHYFTNAAIIKLIKLAVKYNIEFQSDIPPAQRERLKINDSSLKKGGLYDFNNQWRVPHQMHRKGIVVDINNYRVGRDLSFDRLARSIGIGPSWEPISRTPHPHYHLQLLGDGIDD